MNAPSGERILLVDDEPHVLEAFRRTLGRRFALDLAVGGAAAIARLGGDAPYAVLVTDMRMPDVDGLGVLRHAQAAAPQCVRMMLTGNSDLQTAVDAVNDGSVFRFLTKPCSADTLAGALADGITQYRLMRAEKELLEGTLTGSIELATGILALSDPAVFGEAVAVRDRLRELAGALGLNPVWEVEVAAMLAPIGRVTLPEALKRKLRRAEPLDAQETRRIARLPLLARALIGKIPRLEGAARIALYAAKDFDGSGEPADAVAGTDLPPGARLLRIVTDLTALERDGMTAAEAVSCLRERRGAYDPALLERVARVVLASSVEVGELTVQQVTLDQLRAGAMTVRDVLSTDGVLLVARGRRIGTTELALLHTVAQHTGVSEPLEVIAGV